VLRVQLVLQVLLVRLELLGQQVRLVILDLLAIWVLLVSVGGQVPREPLV